MKPTRHKHMTKRLREAARSQRELEKRMFHLKTLYDVSREIGFLISTPAIMKNLLMMVIGTFGVERGLILLSDVRGHRIEAVTQRGLDDTTMAALSQAVDAGSLLNFQDALRLYGCTPFSVKARLTGGSALGDRLAGDPCTPCDSEFLVTLANHP